jgi:endonuclease YncB( thermonuclease family)
MLIRLFIILSLVCTLPGLAVSEAKERTGPAGSGRSLDGDSLVVGARRVNLFAITAPAPGQICREWTGQGQRDYLCGAHARTFLSSLLAGRQTECVLEEAAGKDPRATLIATCYTAGQDLGLALVRAGWALAARHQSLRYVVAEDAARRAKAGLWRGLFTAPGTASVTGPETEINPAATGARPRP